MDKRGNPLRLESLKLCFFSKFFFTRLKGGSPFGCFSRPLSTFLLLAFFSFHEIGCSRLITKPDPHAGFKVPAEQSVLLAKIFAFLSDRLHYLKDLKAIAKFSVQTPQKKIKKKNIIIFRNDLSIRFEVLSILGKPFMYFISNRKDSSIYYPDKNLLFKGAYSPNNIARIIGVNIELENIISYLSGNIIIPHKYQNVVLHENKDYYFLKFSITKNRTKKVFLDKENFLLLKLIEYNLDENNKRVIQFSNYKKIDNYFLPFMIKIEAPRKKTEIIIQYQTVRLNRGVSDSYFELPINKDMQILPLGNHSSISPL